MILTFTVGNYRSFKDFQHFSMIATNLKDEHEDNIFTPEDCDDLRLIKTSFVYGANASGKSNMIMALLALRQYVVNSTDLKLGDEIQYFEPFLLDVSSFQKPVFFEIEFIPSNGVRYKFTLRFNKRDVEYERLVFYPNQQEALLYERTGDDVKFGSQLKGKKKNISNELIHNNLFLSKAANSNHSHLKEIYQYFRNNLIFHTKVESKGYLHSLTSNKLWKQNRETFKELLTFFLLAADSNIQSIDFRSDLDIESQIKIPDNLPEIMKKEIMAQLSPTPVIMRKKYDKDRIIGEVDFDLNEESSGTVKMYDLATNIIEALYTGSALVVDELDASFHPLLSEFVINFFNNKHTNPNNAQLIATTHDTSLLNPELLRRDQIWFSEKKKDGSTILFCLAIFDKNKVRKSTPFDKWYLRGEFGGVPEIDKSFFDMDEISGILKNE
ncbi:MAG: uncharacterized protein QG635_2047 [Bacteroidota bacterium]|nr:uncharacterized protein [Bacteroidota bacterium]